MTEIVVPCRSCDLISDRVYTVEVAQELQGVVTAHTSPPPVGVRRLVREMPLAKSSTRYEAAKRLLKSMGFFVQKLGT